MSFLFQENNKATQNERLPVQSHFVDEESTCDEGDEYGSAHHTEEPTPEQDSGDQMEN